MRTLKLSLAAALAVTTSYCATTAPAFAQAVTTPPKANTKVTPKAPERIEWIQSNEKVVRDPNGFDPETKYNRPDPNSPDYLKDTFVWA